MIRQRWRSVRWRIILALSLSNLRWLFIDLSWIIIGLLLDMNHIITALNLYWITMPLIKLCAVLFSPLHHWAAWFWEIQQKSKQTPVGLIKKSIKAARSDFMPHVERVVFHSAAGRFTLLRSWRCAGLFCRQLFDQWWRLLLNTMTNTLGFLWLLHSKSHLRFQQL